MPPIDDAFALQVLCRIREMRHELERLRDLAHARDFKARVVELHESCRGDRVPADVGEIVDTFLDLAHQTIIAFYGTSAWDDGETIDEAKARMGTFPGSDPSRLTDEELQDINDFADSDARHRLQPHWKVLTNPTSVRRVAAELRRLRADAWLVGAAEEIADSANPYDWQANLVILRKHRDGKV
jgi:hypothetical protein